METPVPDPVEAALETVTGALAELNSDEQALLWERVRSIAGTAQPSSGNEFYSLEKELGRVQDIQQSLLPSRTPDRPDLAFACQYLPSGHASGDYYDFLEPSANHTAVIVADVAGHGAASAVVMAIMRVLAQMHLDQLLSPSGALSVLNRLMTRFIPGDQFVTAIYAIYNHFTHKLSYATAGHPAPILVRPGEGARFLEIQPHFPLKIFDDVTYQSLEVELRVGDHVLLYTDGLTELNDPEGNMLGDERLLQWMCESPIERGAAGALWHLLDHAATFSESVPPVDDFTVVMLQVKDPPPQG